jgi:orotidine-5'-phosphate decarboxylase
VSPGVNVAQHVAAEITQYNSALAASDLSAGSIGPIGAVVGLTAEGASELVGRLPQSLVLAPGLGAQGGTFEDLRTRFGSARLGPASACVVPSASREVLRKGPDLGALSEAIRSFCGRAAEALA